MSTHEGALLPKQKIQHASPDVSVIQHTDAVKRAPMKGIKGLTCNARCQCHMTYRCSKASAHEGSLLPKRKFQHAHRMSVSYDIHLAT